MPTRKWDRVMGEVWPEAQGHVAAELGTGDARRDRLSLRTRIEFLVRLLRPRRAASTAASRADERRRVPQRPAPVRALGGRGLACNARTVPPSRSTISPTASSTRAEPASTTSSSSARCCSAAAACSTAVDELAALAATGRAVGRDRRLSRLHGDRAAVRCAAPRNRLSTSAAAINMRWRARAAPSCMRRPASARGRRSPAGSPSSRN